MKPPVKKYPIGTKIKFVYHPDHHYRAKKDEGLIGIIVGYHGYDLIGKPIIYLPKSNNSHNNTYTWRCIWAEIELLQGQLLFDFMYDGKSK